MSPIYFGFEPRNRGAAKNVVSTPQGDYEPVEPSRFRVYANALFSPSYQLLKGCLGLAVAIITYPVGFFAHMSAEGLMAQSAGDNFLPLKAPGLAVAVRRGLSLRQVDQALLDQAMFTTMQFAGQTVYLKEEPDRGDYLMVKDFREIDTKAKVPGRYLNVDAFESFLLVRSITTRICNLMAHLAESGSAYAVAVQKKNSIGKAPWVNARDDPDAETPMVTGSFEFEELSAFKMEGKADSAYTAFMQATGASGGIAAINSAALFSGIAHTSPRFLQTGQGDGIRSHGLLMKFEPRLASPDINLVGDILGRLFLKSLGDSLEEQLELLETLKAGLGLLRLTRVGEELTHLYKCLEIAVDCNAGMIPIFDGSRYEGSLVAGGPGATILAGGKRWPFQTVASLKNDFLTFSSHASALTAIGNLFPVDFKERVLACRSMFDLRELCLLATFSQSDRDEIVRKAANLDFGRPSWVISPSRLKDALSLIANMVNLNETYPIGRLALFSKDPVTVALSTFGEKSCPSWDIPQGTACSIKKATPPSPPVSINRKGAKGDISDAAWVMVIRTTDLTSGVAEFKEMASSLCYRSSSSTLARKVGHRVFSRDRMAEFWSELRDAVRVVNPMAAYEEDAENLKKRGLESEASTVTEGGAGAKRRRMGV
jgi:hypothetical protein